LIPFDPILQRASDRKGGEAALKALLPHPDAHGALADLPDHRVLAQMTQRIFSAGFVWMVIENKWPGFEAAFLGFDPPTLLGQFDDFWERLCSDVRIVRNPQKIMSVRANAQFVVDLAREHGSAARFIADWPTNDQLGLLQLLAKRGSRLGGHTGQYLLRFLGRDNFMTSRDVVACLRGAGLEIAQDPTSEGDLAKVQAVFNSWREETGLSLTHLSKICAMSTGEQYDVQLIRERSGLDD
jgi:3-methyladenine DNA glycosylase Tag